MFSRSLVKFFTSKRVDVHNISTYWFIGQYSEEKTKWLLFGLCHSNCHSANGPLSLFIAFHFSTIGKCLYYMECLQTRLLETIVIVTKAMSQERKMDSSAYLAVGAPAKQ